MNFIPSHHREPEPDPEQGRPWLTSIAVAAFVILCIAALAFKVLEGSDALQILRDFTAPKQRVGAGIVEKYTRFRSEVVDGGTVMTGFEFASSADSTPVTQFCYFTKDQKGSDVRLHLPLGRKPRGEAAAFFPIAQGQAEQLGFSADLVAKLAHEHCRFDEWE